MHSLCADAAPRWDRSYPRSCVQKRLVREAPVIDASLTASMMTCEAEATGLRSAVEVVCEKRSLSRPRARGMCPTLGRVSD